MNRHPEPQPWAMARLLFTTHLPFLLILWAGFALIMLGITGFLATFGTITNSVWDYTPMALRWGALFYGIHITKDLLPLYVAHGQSRRAFMRHITLFLVVTTSILAFLMTLGYGLERLLYDAMGWQQVISAQRLFTASDQVVPIFITYWLLFLGIMLAGAVGAAGFYRSQESGVVAFLAAFLLVVLILLTVEGNALPFVGRFIPSLDIPLAMIVVFAFGIVGLGFTLMWAFIRDIPIRIQTL